MHTQTVASWLTAAKTVAGYLAAFGFGSLITLYFTVRERRKEWVKDNKKQEWRELISALSQSFHYLKNYSPGDGLVAISGEQEKGLLEADAEARRAIESRIFIAPQVCHESVLEQWQLLAGEKDWNRMVGYWESLHGKLILAAHKDLGIKGF